MEPVSFGAGRQALAFGTQKLNLDQTGACGPIVSVYIRDLDGNLSEVSSYPVGGSDPAP